MANVANNTITPITNPATLTTDSVRVTIVPAISFAFDKSNERSTVNTVGATTALKSSAAPSHKASREDLTSAIIEVRNTSTGEPTDLPYLSESFRIGYAAATLRDFTRSQQVRKKTASIILINFRQQPDSRWHNMWLDQLTRIRRS